MKIKKVDSVSKTAFVFEEYIPLKIKYEISFKEYHPSFEFVKDDASLLELSVGETSHRVSSITLVVCEDYEILEKQLPTFDTVDGDIYIDEEMPESLSHFKTDVFEVVVYSDGAIIDLSHNPSMIYYKSNNVIWGIDENSKISQLIVKMDRGTVKHITNELRLQ